MAHHKCENGMACINNASCSLTGAGFSQTGMAILPVKVRRRGSEKAIAMYVFLDNGSTSTYCTEALMRQLDINGAKTKISLTTLEKKDSLVDSFLVHDLEVTVLDENYIVKLPISVDPFGFAAPFVLTAKKILQDLCKMKLGWDKEIPLEYNVRRQKMAYRPSYAVKACDRPFF